MKNSIKIALLALSSMQSACGVTVPKISEVWDQDIPATKGRIRLSATTQIELEVKKRIFCDLEKAVQRVEKIPFAVQLKGQKTLKKQKFIPENWGAQVSIYLQVDEASALNPGLNLNTPLAAAMTSFAGSAPVATPQSLRSDLGGRCLRQQLE